MSALEAFSVCSGLRSALAGGVGLPGATRLNTCEVEAMLAAMPFEQQSFLKAIRGDVDASRYLWGWLYQLAAKRAYHDGWELIRGSGQMGGLAAVVRDDLLRNDGRRSGERTVAMALKLDRNAYKRGMWPGRYLWLGLQGQVIAEGAVECLRRQMYD